MNLKMIAEKYGFDFVERDDDQIIMAKNTDCHMAEWLVFQHVSDSTKALTIKGNTGQLNLWFHETRTDLSPERLVEFGHDVSEYLFGEKNPELLSALIDPEDWQEITNVQNAFEDERYFPKTEANEIDDSIENVDKAFDEEEIFNCDECEYRECFDCPKALGQDVAIYTFGKGEGV